ncbi:hypothetical protein COV49_04135 [Candidatus Falkowbacteria bacterium CG11_big_fil_rev_8_21_14_0_20_39_10]|uniref:Uncharacterized protein n=1 Tax=Candidatus Falkowbacteria bacterium CG11_big_fil_rev_8_21_14_0_20_39_10 TaxID=1974570 RepID=A0A2M6K8A8_9BACT|nr:MAG: hypothetical protein COV49_04135 [Candidatus Falkowbacteria bacterium CG11_big_fil_rev_8_21_14_0_20_39_10]
MNKLLKQILILTCLVALLVLPYFVFAVDGAQTQSGDTMKSVLNKLQSNSGYAPADQYTASRIAGTAVKAFLSILGVIFIFLTLYGGYVYMMARGNEDEVGKALLIIQRAIIGLIIIVGVYAIWQFIIINFLYG